MESEDLRPCSVYVITNNVNGKNYVGVSIEPDKRWKDHKYASKKSEYPIYKAMRKYGVDKFSFKIICWADNFKAALKIEMDSRRLGLGSYNQTMGGEGIAGYRHTDEAKAKISEAHSGLIRTPEMKKKISDTLSGVPRIWQASEKTLQIMSTAMSGRTLAEETRQKISETKSADAPLCHPDLEYRGHGLCVKCYMYWYHQTTRGKQDPNVLTPESLIIAPLDHRKMQRWSTPSVLKKMAMCHPDRFENCKGLCNYCYKKKRIQEGKDTPKPSVCHPEKPAKSHGLCAMCNTRKKRAEKRSKENEPHSSNVPVPILPSQVAREAEDEAARSPFDGDE